MYSSDFRYILMSKYFLIRKHKGVQLSASLDSIRLRYTHSCDGVIH
jgi:hypothetical protein